MHLVDTIHPSIHRSLSETAITKMTKQIPIIIRCTLLVVAIGDAVIRQLLT